MKQSVSIEALVAAFGLAPAATVFMVLEGKMQAFSKKFSPVITSGWVSTGYGSQLNTPDTISNMAIETEWVHSLLVQRGTIDEEIGMRTEVNVYVTADRAVVTPDNYQRDLIIAE